MQGVTIYNYIKRLSINKQYKRKYRNPNRRFQISDVGFFTYIYLLKEMQKIRIVVMKIIWTVSGKFFCIFQAIRSSSITIHIILCGNEKFNIALKAQLRRNSSATNEENFYEKTKRNPRFLKRTILEICQRLQSFMRQSSIVTR